jgi:hypothetical protein
MVSHFSQGKGKVRHIYILLNVDVYLTKFVSVYVYMYIRMCIFYMNKIDGCMLWYLSQERHNDDDVSLNKLQTNDVTISILHMVQPKRHQCKNISMIMIRLITNK